MKRTLSSGEDAANSTEGDLSTKRARAEPTTPEAVPDQQSSSNLSVSPVRVHDAKEFLKTFSIRDLVQDKPDAVEIRSDATIAQALELLQEKKLVALPVMSLTEKKYLGIVSLLDIAVYIAYAAYFHSKGQLSLDPAKFSDLTSLKRSVGDVLDMTAESSKAHVLGENANIEDALEAFSWGLHRVLVVSHRDGNSSLKILTQTDVCRYLLNHEKELGGILNHTLSSLHLGTQCAIRASSALTALEAYRLMSQKGTSALPIVDSATGELVATISSTDLRGLSQETLPKLLLPAVEYLRFVRNLPPDAPISNTTSTPDSTLGEVLHMLMDNKVRRVWVIDSTRQHDSSVEKRMDSNEEDKNVAESKETPNKGPHIGVVTLTDVIYQFSPWHNWGSHKPSLQ